MKNRTKVRKSAISILVIAAMVSFLIGSSSAVAYSSQETAGILKSDMQLPTPTPYCPESYLELRVDKPLVEIGETFTLTIIFHNLGLPWVYGLGLTPEGLAALYPPIGEWPCVGCDTFTLLAIALGRLEIRSGATGEIYCDGWMWSGATSKVPAVVLIVPNVWRLYLPLVGW